MNIFQNVSTIWKKKREISDTVLYYNSNII